MNKRIVLFLALSACGALLFAEGSPAAISKDGQVAPPAAAKASPSAASPTTAPKTAAASKTVKIVRPAEKSLSARGKVVALSRRGKTGKIEELVLQLKSGRKISIEIPRVLAASRRIKAGDTVKVSYKLDRGRKLATRIAS